MSPITNDQLQNLGLRFQVAVSVTRLFLSLAGILFKYLTHKMSLKYQNESLNELMRGEQTEVSV